MKTKPIVLLAVIFLALYSGKGLAQELELSTGITHKFLMGEQKDFYSPALGIELAAGRQELNPFSADMVTWGLNVGIFRMNRMSAEEEDSTGQYQQLIATKGTYRYDYYYNDFFSFFYGADAGFQFITPKSEQPMTVPANNGTRIFTRAVVAPNVGVNFEFSPYIAVYYKFQYEVGKYLVEQPKWGSPSSKWNHLLTNAAGLRIKIY